MRGVDRGQSETVGVILLTAVVVVLAGTVGVFVLSNFDGSSGDRPNVDVRSDVTGQQVVIEHFGGDPYAVSEIRIDIRQQGDDISRPLSNFTHDGDTGTFEAGDRWEKDFSEEGDELGGEIRVRVIDEKNNRIIHDEPYVVAGE